MSSRLSLIIQREYLATVGKKSFVVMTVLIPILFILLCGVLPALLAGVKSDDRKTVALVDPSGRYAPLVENTDEYVFLVAPQPGDGQSLYEYYEAFRSGGADAVAGAPSSEKELYAIVSIPAALDSSATVTVYSPQAVAGNLDRVLADALEPAIRHSRAARYGIDSLDHILAACDVDLAVRNVKWDEGGEETLSSTMLSQILGMVLAMLIYMFVLTYGGMIMNSVVEEKTNRIVEVIVSSCRPMELMFGKIIGVAFVGLTQIAIWAAMLGIAAAVLGASAVGLAPAPEMTALAGGEGAEMLSPAATAAAAGGGKMAEIVQMLASVNWLQLGLCFLFYFVGGYLLYASIFAAFGSAIDQPGDSSQFMMPVVMVLIFALYAGIYSVDNPDGPLAWWCSLIPFTSPIVMLVRLPYDVPAWEIAASIALLYATAIGITYLAGRIYRTGILMYGKKYTLREIFRWMKRH